MTTTALEIPPELLSSVCMVESHHNINAIHKHDGQGNSVGICQIKLKTARWMGFQGTEYQLMDPEINIYFAGKYLKYNLLRYNGDVHKALSAYNRGNARKVSITTYSNKVVQEWRKRSYAKEEIYTKY